MTREKISFYRKKAIIYEEMGRRLEGGIDYGQVVELAKDGIIVIDKMGMIIHWNKSAEEIFGYTKGEAVGQPVHVLIAPPEYRAAQEYGLDQFQRTGEGPVIGKTIELKAKDKLGRIFTVELSIGAIENGAVGIIRDITQRKKMEKEMEYLATHDGLTGLFNSGYLRDQLNQQNLGNNFPFSLIIIDGDGLKDINDTFGHNTGDELLQKIAKLLKEQCRSNDIASRFGGDEFAILLPKTNEGDLKGIMNRIREKSNLLGVSFSIGGTTVIQTEEDIKKIIKKADDMMYKDKKRFKKTGRHLII